jgi:hypothetical protein
MVRHFPMIQMSLNGIQSDDFFGVEDKLHWNMIGVEERRIARLLLGQEHACTRGLTHYPFRSLKIYFIYLRRLKNIN